MTNPASGGEYTPDSWLKQADSDLATAYLLMRECRFDWASYAAAQAAEKAIKAMLIAWGADLADQTMTRPSRGRCTNIFRSFTYFVNCPKRKNSLKR
jgi:hypothetical protein